MKWFGILLAVTWSFFGMAQDTNFSNTNLVEPDATYIEMTNEIARDVNMPTNSRVMSLDDCIQVALEHNFTIRIARYNPALARYTLWGSYGVYDPNFNASYDHTYSLSPGGIDAQGRSFVGVEADTDQLNTGLAGSLPWGMSYSLGVSASDQTGSRPTTFTSTNITGFRTNTFFDVNTNPVVLLSPNFATTPGRSPFETSSGSAGALTLTQPLLRNFWINSDRFTIYVNKKELQKSEADFRDTLMSTVTQVETAYLRLIQAQENVEVQRKALELADSTLSENRKRVQIGAMAPLDEQQAEAQAATSRAQLLQAESAEGTQQRVLKSLLSDNYTNNWLNIVIKPKDRLVAIPQQFDLQESWRKALAQGGNPVRLQQLRLTLEENEARVRLQKNQLFPELDLTGSYGYSGTGREFSDAFGQIQSRTSPFWSIGVQMNVPLSQTAARNNLKAAKASRDQQKLTLEAQEQNTLISIENDISTIRSDYESVKATHEARLYAEAALEAEQKKFENGKSTLFTILGLQSKLTSARSDEITALANYNVDLSTFSFDEGSTFDRLKIDVNMD
ncbi:MAG TPA: TolC family protein [Candidatus Angelobacter sp.]|nr:TolC family protein [Candidatus Angelobacter sp.]